MNRNVVGRDRAASARTLAEMPLECSAVGRDKCARLILFPAEMMPCQAISIQRSEGFRSTGQIPVVRALRQTRCVNLHLRDKHRITVLVRREAMNASKHLVRRNRQAIDDCINR